MCFRASSLGANSSRYTMNLLSTASDALAPPALANSFPLNSTFGALLLGTYFSLM